MPRIIGQKWRCGALVTVLSIVFLGIAALFAANLLRCLDQPIPSQPGWIWSAEGDTLGSVVDTLGTPLDQIHSVVVVANPLTAKKTSWDLMTAMWKARSIRPPSDFKVWEFSDDLDYSADVWTSAYLKAFADWRNRVLHAKDLVVVRSERPTMEEVLHAPWDVRSSHWVGTHKTLYEILDPGDAKVAAQLMAQLTVQEFLEAERTYSSGSNGTIRLRIRVNDAEGWIRQALALMTADGQEGTKAPYRLVKSDRAIQSGSGIHTLVGRDDPDVNSSSLSFRVLDRDAVQVSRWDPD